MKTPAIPTTSLPVEGLAWLSEWELPFEGGYTLLWKCAWANSAIGADLCHAVFGRKLLSANNVGRHGRSLLDTGWVDKNSDRGIAYMRDKIREGALTSRAGRWTRHIAADGVFRYCRACLARGYQSALFQIDGLVSCPIHGQPLETICHHCGAAGQRYAITDVGFAMPFHCGTCMEPLAGTFDPATWPDASFRHAALTALTPLAGWLTQLAASSLRWHGWDEWHFPLRWHCSEEDRRIATLEVLLKVFPPDRVLLGLSLRNTAPQIYPGTFTKIPTPLITRGASGATDEANADRLQLYKAMRRHVTRRLRGCAQVATQPLPTLVTVSQADGTMQLDVSACPRAQALAIWRFHFEEAQYDPHVLVLRPAALQWPTDGPVNCAAWAGFLLASFHAAVAAFDAWRAQAVKLPNADMLGKDPSRARALHAQYAQLLAPVRCPTFPAVSLLMLQDGSEQPGLIVVGPADIASGSTLLESNKKLWCECHSSWGNGCRHGGGLQLPLSIPFTVAGAPSNASNTINLLYVVPMEQLRLPPTLDGSTAKAERDAKRCWLKADNDLQAISQWLAESPNPATRKAYARQIEKALIWCVAQRGIALSQMTVDDVKSFVNFLADPVPHDVWLPSSATGATARRWSPFRKVGSLRSRGYTVRILSLLFHSWSRQLYMNSNPCRSIMWSMPEDPQRQAISVPEYVSHGSLLTQNEWSYLARQAHNDSLQLIAHLVLDLAYYAALKPTEIASIRLEALRRYRSACSGIDIWSVSIPTRNAQRREVFLLAPVTEILATMFPASPEEFKAFVSARPRMYLLDLSDSSLNHGRVHADVAPNGQLLSVWLSPFFGRVAQIAAQAGDLIAAHRLRQATLSWLSNAFETHLEYKGKRGKSCWNVLGACKLCPPSMMNYLPDRRAPDLAQLEREIGELGAALASKPSLSVE
jgi:hypothetical protein